MSEPKVEILFTTAPDKVKNTRIISHSCYLVFKGAHVNFKESPTEYQVVSDEDYQRLMTHFQGGNCE